MGRSVSYPSNAVVVFDDADFEDQWDFEDYVDDYLYRLKALWPSVGKDDQWIGREDHVIASNRHAVFGISEYCGLVSLWVKARDDFDWYEDRSGLAQHWVDQIADKFQKEFGSLVKLGSFSNGEGVYARKGD